MDITYKPTPYSEAREVPRHVLTRYESINVFLDLPDPDDADANWIEHQFTLFYQVAPAEEDVGIMQAYIGDWFYAFHDGKILPKQVWTAIDAIDCRDGSGYVFGTGGKRNGYVNPTIQKWHEYNLERAMEA